ncbi:hypothetical protein BHE74_00003822 [Ensete ventricosum]|nr:hypothetical protein BHE74_00003822 [Ensete ventricosum]
MRATRFCAPSRIRSRDYETLGEGSTQRTMLALLARGMNTGSLSTVSDNLRLSSEQRRAWIALPIGEPLLGFGISIDAAVVSSRPLLGPTSSQLWTLRDRRNVQNRPWVQRQQSSSRAALATREAEHCYRKSRRSG